MPVLIPILQGLRLFDQLPADKLAEVSQTMTERKVERREVVIEAELSQLEPEEKTVFLQELGMKESGLDTVIRAAYALLGLQTYFTAGVQEVRAWTFRKGWKAPACAGVIHTDFERGFIRAETIGWKDFETYGSQAACKEKGLMRSEGKEYVVADGDILNFLFNV